MKLQPNIQSHQHRLLLFKTMFAIYYIHAKIKEFVTLLLLICLTITVFVYMVSTVHDVNMTVKFVHQRNVGIMVKENCYC